MKVYTCNNFKGHWPVGTAAIVVAPNSKRARELLGEALGEGGLKLEGDEELLELDLTKSHAIILNDGQY